MNYDNLLRPSSPDLRRQLTDTRNRRAPPSSNSGNTIVNRGAIVHRTPPHLMNGRLRIAAAHSTSNSNSSSADSDSDSTDSSNSDSDSDSSLSTSEATPAGSALLVGVGLPSPPTMASNTVDGVVFQADTVSNGDDTFLK